MVGRKGVKLVVRRDKQMVVGKDVKWAALKAFLMVDLMAEKTAVTTAALMAGKLAGWTVE